MITNEIFECINQLKPSQSVVLAGLPDSGKATCIEALAKSTNVQKLLQIRENTHTPITRVLVTDYEKIPEDRLFVHADLNYRFLEDFVNDLAFEQIIFKSLMLINDGFTLDWSLTKSLKEILDIKSDSLCSLIGITKSYEWESLLLVLKSIPFADLLTWFTGLPVGMQENSYAVIDHLHQIFLQNYKGIRDEFYATISDLINNNVDSIIEFLSIYGAVIRKVSEDSHKVLIDLSQEEYNNEIFKALFKSGQYCLFSNLTLVFRCADDALKDLSYADYSSHFRCIELIALEDLTGDEQYDLEVLNAAVVNHSNQILFCVNCNNESTLQLTFDYILKIKGSCKTYILLTHLDQLLLSYAVRDTSTSKFSKDFKADLTEANNKLQDKLNQIFESGVENLGTIKPKRYFGSCITYLNPSGSKELAEELQYAYSYTTLLPAILNVFKVHAEWEKRFEKNVKKIDLFNGHSNKYKRNEK